MTSVKTVTLQETSEVVNVSIAVRQDAENTFLVTDASEAQVRIYDDAGNLQTYFGRRGDGPGELQDPTVAIRLRSGEILVANLVSRGSIFSPDGRNLVRTIDWPFGPVFDVDALTDSLLLVAGAAPDHDGRLHVWDLAVDSVVTSFLIPRLPAAFLPAIRLAGLTAATVRRDTIAAVFALSDTLYLFERSGRSLARLPLNAAGLRRMETGPPLGPGRQAEVREWVGSFSMVADLHWHGPAHVLVQYQDRENLQPQWRLLGVDLRTGETTFEVRDTPRLLTTTEPGDSTVIFVDPNSMTPNVWTFERFHVFF